MDILRSIDFLAKILISILVLKPPGRGIGRELLNLEKFNLILFKFIHQTPF